MEVSAEMPGSVWRINVIEGQAVQAGDVLVILESMKMEIPVSAPIAGTVTTVGVTEGDTIDEGAVLVILD